MPPGNVHIVYCRDPVNASKHCILLYTTPFTLVHCMQRYASHAMHYVMLKTVLK